MAEKVSVLGGGSWATALTKILDYNNHDIHWWLRQPDTVEYIRKFGHNPKYLSSVTFALEPANITSDAQACVKPADYVVIAVPSAYLMDSLKGLTPDDFAGKTVISATKGMAPDSIHTVTEYIHDKFGVPQDKLAHISGPCHAEEVAAEKLSYLTFSSPDMGLASKLAEMFQNRFMQTQACDDMLGTEYASVLKNIYAIAAGMSVGLGYGDNYRAVLVSRAMDEMRQFLEVMHPGSDRNILYPAYLGDTLVTAYSQHSRNRTFGLMIGNGYTLNAAILELNMVAEGYYAAKAINIICENNNLNLPIARAVYDILYEHLPASKVFRKLSAGL